MRTKNKYEKEKLGEIIKLVKMSSCGVLVTDEGINTYCSPSELLTLISFIIDKTKKYVPEEAIRHSVEIGLRNNEEKIDYMINTLENTLNKIDNIIDKKKDKKTKKENKDK